MVGVRTHPGQVLAEEFMKPRGLDTVAVAALLGMPEPGIAAVIATTAPVTPELAAKLAVQFGATPELWLNLQAAHDREASLPLTEQQQRRWYVHWLTTTADSSLDPFALLELTTSELAHWCVVVHRERMLGNLEWGRQHAAGASAAQRRDVIDAAVALDAKGRYFGTEPAPVTSAGGCLDEGPVLWARARRKQLKGMSGRELADECRRVLDADSARLQRHQEAMAIAGSYASQRGRELVSFRYSYRQALLDAAAHLRGQGVRAKTANSQLAREPFLADDGSVVTSAHDRIIVKRCDDVIGDVSMGQFQREYWRQAKISGYSRRRKTPA